MCQQIAWLIREKICITRANGDPVQVVAMSPLGRQNPTLVTLVTLERVYIFEKLIIVKGFLTQLCNYISNVFLTFERFFFILITLCNFFKHLATLGNT